MPKANPATAPTRSIGKTNPTLSEANCSASQCCLVELTNELRYCYNLEMNCPVKKTTLSKVIKQCGIQERFRIANFEHIENLGVPKNLYEQYSEIKNYADDLKDNISKGRGLLLKGAVGTMKTTFAVAVLQKHLALGGSGLFVTMSGLLDNIFTLKAMSMNKWAKFEQQIRDTPLLVLDDLGAEHTEGWVLTKVDSIIAERYNRCRSTIITTNLSAQQLRGVYAERVIDRLSSTLKVINFSGQSLRRLS